MRLLLLLCACLLYGCSDSTNSSENNVVPAAPVTPLIAFTVMDDFPHDTTSYTEGFLVHDGELFESTGHVPEFPYTRSLFGVVDRRTGKIAVKVDRESYFVEGIAFLNKKIYQLTYKTQVGFIYDAKTFRQLDSFRYANAEGWGMTTDGIHLIMSDGTAELTFADPAGFRLIKKLKVTENGMPRDSLNELEYI
ncbi:MAG TPA: glutaminyl-peptide cyclotransferase, partial [Puia sp.]|nr:glutaminyl-peptide cyclotransferase [Puia sp.]